VNSKKKIIISFIFLAIALFAAVPKVYIHKLLGHDHSYEHVPLYFAHHRWFNKWDVDSFLLN